MEKTPHVLLVGSGAQQFALQQGFPLEMMLTPDFPEFLTLPAYELLD